MVSALTTQVRKVGKNVMAVYSSTLASCIMTMVALADEDTGDGLGSGSGIGGFTADSTFDNMKNTIGQVIASAFSMLQAFVIPLATVACLCAILVMYLPGMSNKTTDKCKTVIWSCIATVIVAFALSSIFNLAKTIGGKL